MGDPSGEERKGGSAAVGKMLFSAGAKQLAVCAYCPPRHLMQAVVGGDGVFAAQAQIDATQWLQDVLTVVGRGQLVAHQDPMGMHVAHALIPGDAAAGVFPIKLKDEGLQAAINYLKARKCFPDGDDDY